MRHSPLAIAFTALLFSAGAASAQTTHTVGVSGFAFVPPNITIQLGDTVQWVFSGFMDHTVTENLGAFDQPLTPANPMVTIQFDPSFLTANPRPNDRYDYFCIPHLFFGMVGSVTVVSPAWTDIGFGLAGTSGVPSFVGSGQVAAGSAGSLTLTNANPNAYSILFVTLGTITPTPFFGGTLAPVPPTIFIALTLDGAGGHHTPFLFPAGVPSGSVLTAQWGVTDPGATQGVALSNALQATTP